jgi:hypothetical protein
MLFASSLIPFALPCTFGSFSLFCCFETADPKHHSQTLSIFFEINEKLNPHLMGKKNHEKKAVVGAGWLSVPCDTAFDM